MARERAGHTLQTTALVNEVYLRLLGAMEVPWQDRAHFALSAQLMRRVLVDHARGRGRAKRGGAIKKLSLEESIAIPVGRDTKGLELLHLNLLGKMSSHTAGRQQQRGCLEIGHFGRVYPMVVCVPSMGSKYSRNAAASQSLGLAAFFAAYPGL